MYIQYKSRYNIYKVDLQIKSTLSLTVVYATITVKVEGVFFLLFCRNRFKILQYSNLSKI